MMLKFDFFEHKKMAQKLYSFWAVVSCAGVTAVSDG